MLHPQLAKDCIPVGDLSVCRILLMNNSHFPWLVLVPMRENLREIFDLTENDYHTVMSEVRHTARQFNELTNADKMNVATLGNLVPQLHIHVIARYRHDSAWPSPVWNSPVSPEPYSADLLSLLSEKIRKSLALA